MVRQHDKLPLLFLKPGEIYFADTPTVVSTLLGSCVAVTMFSARHCVGAICHALLPMCRNPENCDGTHREGGKYVECSIRLMLRGLQVRGVARSEIEAKVFGGSDMFDSAETRAGSIGHQNMDKALELLAAESIQVVSSDMGGPRGRKIFFYTHTGEVLLKRLRRSEM